MLAIATGVWLGGCGGDTASTAGVPQARQVVEEPNALRAEVWVDRPEITTAQRITLTIETRLREGFESQELEIQSALPKDWRIIDDRSTPLAEAGGWRGSRRTVVVEPFLDGEFSIGALEFTAWSKSQEAPVTLRTSPMPLIVRSVLGEGEDQTLADVKTVVDPPAMNRAWIWVPAGAGLLALAGVAWWLVRRFRVSATAEPIRRGAHEIALERLEALLASALLEHARFKEFYAEASWILRRYIEDRFGLHAPKQTTEEFLAESRISPALSRDDLEGLESFLRACDEVKFAAGVATRAQAESVAEAVRHFVERTRNVESLVIVDEPILQPSGVAA